MQNIHRPLRRPSWSVINKAGGGSREIQENLDAKLVVFARCFFGFGVLYDLLVGSEIKVKTVNKDVIASMNLYCIMIMIIFAAV